MPDHDDLRPDPSPTTDAAPSPLDLGQVTANVDPTDRDLDAPTLPVEPEEPTGPLPEPTVLQGRRHYELTHVGARVRDIPADWAEVSSTRLYLEHLAEACGRALDLDPIPAPAIQAGHLWAFVTTDGRIFPAYVTEALGYVVRFEVLGSWEEGEVSVYGELLPGWYVQALRRHVPDPLAGGTVVPAPIAPTDDLIQLRGFDLQPIEVETGGVDLVQGVATLSRRYVYRNRTRGDKVLAIVHERFWAGHPVSEAEISYVVRDLDAQGYEPDDSIGYATDYPTRTIHALDPYETDRQDYGARPIYRYRIVADLGLEDEAPILDALRATAHLERPRGKFLLWGTSRDTGVVGNVARAQEDWSETARLLEYLSRKYLRDESGLLEVRDMYERRYLASALYVAQSGEQKTLGGTVTGSIYSDSLNAVETYQALLDGAEDESLRPVNYLEADGSLVTAEGRPGHVTNRRVTFNHRNNKDDLDQGGRYPPTISPISGRSGDDTQHVQDHVIDAFLQHWSSPSYEEVRRAMLERDESDSRLYGGYLNPSARGVGRPLQSLAAAAMLFSGTAAGADALETILRYLEIVEKNWAGGKTIRRFGFRPILPIQRFRATGSIRTYDPRTDRLSQSINPYEQASAGRGLVQAADALRYHGLEDYAVRCEALALVGGFRTVLLCAVRERGGTGRLTIPYNILALDGEEEGLRLPDEWMHEDSPAVHPGKSWYVWSNDVPERFLALVEKYAALSLEAFFPDAVKIAERMLEERSDRSDLESDRAYRFGAVPGRLFPERVPGYDDVPR